MDKSNNWPELPYEKFKPTAHLLHMLTQAIGKIKLLTPFEPQWANVPLWITSRGLTSGPIPYKLDTFTIDIDIHSHTVVMTTSQNQMSSFNITSDSVANLIKTLLDKLQGLGFAISINTKPQEIPNPIIFEKDVEERIYDKTLAYAWWRILVSSTIVLQRYHARFTGKTQPIGFMWGTFDLRDVRYDGKSVDASKLGYLRRNAMNAGLIECGWWSGNDNYPKPAYYSFTYPEPSNIAEAKLLPKQAFWDTKNKLFLLDYDAVRQSNSPEDDLFSFFESTYQAGAKLAGWDKNLESSGQPER